jgi:hypothetical protein
MSKLILGEFWVLYCEYSNCVGFWNWRAIRCSLRAWRFTQSFADSKYWFLA